MARKMRRISNKGKISLIGGIVAVIAVAAIAFFLLNQSPIVLAAKTVDVEINTEDYNPLDNVEDVRSGDKKDVTVDASKVDYNKLGEYDIVYKIGDKEVDGKIKVVDTKAPTFDIVDLDTDLGVEVKASEMAQNIEDATETTVTFKEDYDFDKEGTYDVVVVVTDAAGNETEKSGKVSIVKDEEKPTIEGADSELKVKLDNTKADYTVGITVKDNRDPEPKLTVNSDDVNVKKEGTYTVKYTATDRSGNKATAERKIKVVKNLEIGTTKQTDEKIVFLTFDDGPSSNTKKILDILDKYDAKATFFVTGNNQEDNKYIKEAYDAGHTIGLHTYCHEYNEIYASTTAYFDDLKKISDMVKSITGEESHYIRFPGGSSNTVSKKYSPGIMTTLAKEVIERGYQYYDWNADSTDASGNNVAVSKLIANGTSSTANNINILCHDTQAKGTTVEALPKIIEHYKNLGYKFKGIDDNSFVPHQGINN